MTGTKINKIYDIWDIGIRQNNSMGDIKSYIQLLRKFSQLPHEKNEITFMEICKYPYSRFEEICSRVLQFYFNPVAEHKLHDLLLHSLLELVQQANSLYDKQQIRIRTEEDADGKRMDLLIETPDFIVCIENKIMAAVYNPLNIYKKNCMYRYGNKKCIFIVLSARRITDINELKYIHQNGFRVITYADFFRVVKLNMGSYLTTCNQKYLTYLLDFIKTIENMTHRIEQNPENEFFFENQEEIKELIIRYQNYQNNILSIQKEQISILKTKIIESTKAEWWVWEGWDLGISFNDKGPRIGIESSYHATKDNPIGEFKIYITTWRKKDWYPYKQQLLEKYPKRYLDEDADGRVYFHVDVIKDNNVDLILNRLTEYYQVVNNLAAEIK